MPARRIKKMPLAISVMVAKEEGFRAKIYRCSEGYPTIGYGWAVGPKGAPLHYYKHMQISEAAARFILKERLDHHWRFLHESKHQPAKLFKRLSPARQAVFVSMAYQLGDHGLHKFVKMLAALEREDYDEAAKEMLDSLWHRQTPARAKRHAEQMKKGEWLSYYKQGKDDEDDQKRTACAA